MIFNLEDAWVLKRHIEATVKNPIDCEILLYLYLDKGWRTAREVIAAISPHPHRTVKYRLKRLTDMEMLSRKDAPKEGAPHRVPYVYKLSFDTRLDFDEAMYGKYGFIVPRHRAKYNVFSSM